MVNIYKSISPPLMNSSGVKNPRKHTVWHLIPLAEGLVSPLINLFHILHYML